ncbi:MAG: glycogen debranching enzyme GlgX, partial [Corynebacterium sp.]|nr:glycogen debranching enzyme GlgX [Corynebacterium sp.]
MTEMPVTHARPWPLGVTPTGTGVNVAVWAPDADQVEFCVFSGGQGTDGDGADGADTAEQRFVLPHTDGGVRYGHVPGIGVGARYGLRAAGPHDPNHGLRFNPAKLRVAPYARALASPRRGAP